MAFPSGLGGNPRYGVDPGGPPAPNMIMPGLRPAYRGPPATPIYYSVPTQPGPFQPQLGPATFVSPQAAAAFVGPPGLLSQPVLQPVQPVQQGRPAQLDPNFATCNMRNSTGGFGCEPGYNYFFPAEHTKIHVLKTGSTPPWQLPANFLIQFHACHVPVSTTVAELMRGFGARNPNAKKNVITEVCPGGGGRWYKGIALHGDDAESMAMPIKELGWDATRTGFRGQKKVVYIYVQKD